MHQSSKSLVLVFSILFPLFFLICLAFYLFFISPVSLSLSVSFLSSFVIFFPLLVSYYHELLSTRIQSGLYLNLFRAHISNPSCAKSNPFTTPFLPLGGFMHNAFAPTERGWLIRCTDRAVSLFANHWIDQNHYRIARHECVYHLEGFDREKFDSEICTHAVALTNCNAIRAI